MVRYVNDGSAHPPTMEVWLNLDNLRDLTPASVFGEPDGPAGMGRLIRDGFRGVQVTHPGPLTFESALPHCGLDRISVPGEAEPVFSRHAGRGDRCLTLHVGWGTEDDDEVDRLVEAVLQCSDRFRLPAFIETHRATITQDMWRTVRITRRFPEVRFNGDFSHYYCGQEMEYGDFDAKLDFLQPVFDRIGFLHGRIASSGCIQAAIESATDRPRHATGRHDYLANFRKLWTRAMAGFIRHAGPGAVLIFAPELLSSEYDYARLIPGPDGWLVEETDRYAEALLYKELAEQCFVAASLVIHEP